MVLYDERWLPVVGYEGLYEVSDFGRVKSLARNKSNGVWQAGRVLRPGPQRRGYLTVSLCDVAGVKKSRRVHRLVLAAFVGECPPGLLVCHRNDVPADNRLSNLYYGTRSENSADAFSNGRFHVHKVNECVCGNPRGEYRDPNTGLWVCEDCREIWRETNEIYAA